MKFPLIFALLTVGFPKSDALFFSPGYFVTNSSRSNDDCMTEARGSNPPQIQRGDWRMNNVILTVRLKMVTIAFKKNKISFIFQEVGVNNTINICEISEFFFHTTYQFVNSTVVPLLTAQ